MIEYYQYLLLKTLVICFQQTLIYQKLFFPAFVFTTASHLFLTIKNFEKILKKNFKLRAKK
jgi:hypothetical protein